MSKSGLYIHIPFCASKCPYCDFFSVKYDELTAHNYVNKLLLNLPKYEKEIDTIYFGGGTPSILEPSEIRRILDAVRAKYNISSNSEITIECNPSKDLSKDFFEYNKMGINRISLGMQSAIDKERFSLGRRAGKAEVLSAINNARQNGITNISLDLMLGIPKQNSQSLSQSIDFIKSTNVPHISAYMLKIEENTKFFEMRNILVLPSEDEVCDLYLQTIDELEKIGIMQYEISNFSKIGFESKHNIKYWQLDEYLGIGASAHSFVDGKRYFTDKDFNIVDDGLGGSLEEKIMLGIRLNKGISKNLIKKDYQNLVEMGFIVEKGNNIALTPKGMLISNTIINELTQ